MGRLADQPISHIVHLAAQAGVLSQGAGDMAQGQQQAVAQLAAQIHQQAMVITYSECFWVLGVSLILMLPLILLLRRPPVPQPAVVAR